MRVPGPPRGRRRRTPGDLFQRVEAMRAAEAGGVSAEALLTFLGDVILLVKDLALDPRVPEPMLRVMTASRATFSSTRYWL